MIRSHTFYHMLLYAIDRLRLYGLRLGRRGDLVFRGLAAKYLQLHGGTSVPPATPFSGDGIVVEATAATVPPGGNPWEDGAVSSARADRTRRGS